jgi:hypothetical protein
MLLVSACFSRGSSQSEGDRPDTISGHGRENGNVRSQEISATDGSLVVGRVVIRGLQDASLRPLAHDTGYTNGVDTFYTTQLSDGGTFVLYRYAPSSPTITTNPYPEIVLPGTNVRYVKPIPVPPFYKEHTVKPPFTFAMPYSQFKRPALLSDAGVGIFPVAESAIFEEAVEPFVSAYPKLRVIPDTPSSMRLRFDEVPSEPRAVTLRWAATEHTATTTTYVASISEPSTRAIAIHIAEPTTKRRAWYRTEGTWMRAFTEHGGSHDPDLLILHTEKNTDEPNAILIESQSGPPAEHATLYSSIPGYVERARWAAFTVYDGQTAGTFFARSMTPSFKAYNDRRYILREEAPARHFPSAWRDLLERLGFTDGKNLLNPKFFSRGFPAAGDPDFEIRDKVSVSWVSDESALQAVMGRRLYGFQIDRRYAEGVKVFYDPATAFYYGALRRATGEFTSADTASDGVVIGYNYLLSLMRLTEMIGTPTGLSQKDVQKLVDRVLPVLQEGYVDGYLQVPYLWGYPNLEQYVQAEYGMGRELSEAQLSYVCGLWWLRTHRTRYRECQTNALRLPEELALTLRGSSHLWGLDVVHGAYVNDALLLAYRTMHSRRHLDAAVNGWREELLFLFSTLNYPETSFDDRAMAVTSFFSTFADLHRGNYWRGDAWNNARTLWSLSKLLAYVDDPRIVWQLKMARETHKQTMPRVDAVFNPEQRSDFYNQRIDTNDLELNWEGLGSHYSTQISFSNDVWREAFIFDSIRSSDATVYRIPGAVLTDPGLAYVVGQPNKRVHLRIAVLDCTFTDGRATKRVRLDGSGIARVKLRSPRR